jgi:hypothetical protein
MQSVQEFRYLYSLSLVAIGSVHLWGFRHTETRCVGCGVRLAQSCFGSRPDPGR